MARKSTRELWAAKLSGKLTDTTAKVGSALTRKRYEGIILGVDPSLRGTGLAVIQFSRSHEPRLLYSETVKIKEVYSMPQCLGQIFLRVTDALEQFPVNEVALEQTIYVQNFRTAQILGAARGSAIAAVAVKMLPVHEYPPLSVKQAVVGFGRASKEQLGKTLKSILMLPETLPLDESDAAGVALCHAYTLESPLGTLVKS